MGTDPVPETCVLLNVIIILNIRLWTVNELRYMYCLFYGAASVVHKMISEWLTGRGFRMKRSWLNLNTVPEFDWSYYRAWYHYHVRNSPELLPSLLFCVQSALCIVPQWFLFWRLCSCWWYMSPGLAMSVTTQVYAKEMGEFLRICRPRTNVLCRFSVGYCLLGCTPCTVVEIYWFSIAVYSNLFQHQAHSKTSQPSPDLKLVLVRYIYTLTRDTSYASAGGDHRYLYTQHRRYKQLRTRKKRSALLYGVVIINNMDT